MKFPTIRHSKQCRPTSIKKSIVKLGAIIARSQNTDTFNGLQIAKILFRRPVEDPVAKSDLNQEYSED